MSKAKWSVASGLTVMLLASAPAAAQYVATPLSGVPYPALTSASIVTLTVDGGVPNADRGRATVPLGFSMPFYQQTYSSLTVTANGVAFFEPDPDSNANYILNFAIPNTTAPNGVLAPFWDDLNGNNANSALKTQPLSGANGLGLAIEWSDWNREFGSYSLSFQIRAWENGIIEFFYGRMEGNGAAISATIGIESPTGGAGTAPFSCGGLCDVSTLSPPNPDGGATAPGITYLKFGPPAGIDLQATSLRATAISEPDAGTLLISTELQTRNFGTVASGAFTYRLYLSQDTIVDGSDVELTPTPVPMASLGPNETRVSSSTGEVAKPSSGSVYVLAFVDFENAVGEPPERRSNNTASTSVPYSAGVDLVAERIVAPLSCGPGDGLAVPVSFTNQGFEAAGSVPVKIWASTDARLDATDRLLTTQAISVVGGQAVRQDVSFTMPSNIPGDSYFLVLQLDGDPGVIIEASKTNNLVFSQTKMVVRQPDLAMEAVLVRRAAPPSEQTTTAFFGEPIRLDAQLRNQGGSPASNVSVQFYLSDNETLNGLSDTTIGSVTGLSLAAGETRVVTLTATVPTHSPSNQLLQTQSYFFFASAIAPGLGETSVTNNSLSSVPTLVRGPAPNLLPLSVQGPARVGAGEVVPVTRTLANHGNRDATGVTYRYYLSANEQITVEDTLLRIQTPGGLVDERAVDLAVNAQSSANEFVLIPPWVTTSSLYLGVLVDPTNAVDESSKEDNGLAGQQVQVVGKGLEVATSQLPDGLVGRPYSVTLASRGGAPSAWSATGVPAGLTVSSSGVVSGVPTVSGAFGLLVTVSSGAASTTATVTLRVLPPTASLEIATRALAAPVRLLAYDAQLGASGGLAPYAWSVLSGELPSGLSLTPAGRLFGLANGTLGSTANFSLGVRDAVGNSATASFSLITVDAAPFQIVSAPLADGVVGSQYLALLAVKNAGGAPVATPIDWQVVNGSLPDGLAFEKSTADTVALAGTPKRTGLFSFRIEAVDVRGRVAGLNAVVLIYGPAVTVSGDVPTTVARGAEVAVAFVATPAQPGSTWVMRDGRLPAGVSLTESGVLTGTVAGDAVVGGYTFTVGVGATRAELRGLATYRIDVSSAESSRAPGGCSTSDQGQAVWLVVLLVLLRRSACPSRA